MLTADMSAHVNLLLENGLGSLLNVRVWGITVHMTRVNLTDYGILPPTVLY